MLHIPTTWTRCWCTVTECIQLSLLKTRAPCLFEKNSNASMGWGKLRLSNVPIILLAFCYSPQAIPVNADAWANIHHHHPGTLDWLWLLFIPFVSFFSPWLCWLNSLAGKFATGSATEQKMFIHLENTWISRARQQSMLLANNWPLLDDCV